MESSTHETQQNIHNDENNGFTSIQKPTNWEIAALEQVSEDYWDDTVMPCGDWKAARDKIAIDGLICSLLKKLRRAEQIHQDLSTWPMEYEEEIRSDWIESGGKT